MVSSLRMSMLPPSSKSAAAFGTCILCSFNTFTILTAVALFSAFFICTRARAQFTLAAFFVRIITIIRILFWNLRTSWIWTCFASWSTFSCLAWWFARGLTSEASIGPCRWIVGTTPCLGNISTSSIFTYCTYGWTIFVDAGSFTRFTAALALILSCWC